MAHFGLKNWCIGGKKWNGLWHLKYFQVWWGPGSDRAVILPILPWAVALTSGIGTPARIVLTFGACTSTMAQTFSDGVFFPKSVASQLGLRKSQQLSVSASLFVEHSTKIKVKCILSSFPPTSSVKSLSSSRRCFLWLSLENNSLPFPVLSLIPSSSVRISVVHQLLLALGYLALMYQPQWQWV